MVWLAALVVPLCLHVYVGFSYAAGGYDGKHCAGLLDAVWECSEFEYYLSYIFNPFVVVNLVVYYAVSVALAIVSLGVCKAWFKQDAQKNITICSSRSLRSLGRSAALRLRDP